MKLTVTVASPKRRTTDGMTSARHEHHHSEDTGQRRRKAAGCMADFLQVRRRPDTDRELAEDGVDDV